METRRGIQVSVQGEPSARGESACIFYFIRLIELKFLALLTGVTLLPSRPQDCSCWSRRSMPGVLALVDK
jgi:hypothetical protein